MNLHWCAFKYTQTLSHDAYSNITRVFLASRHVSPNDYSLLIQTLKQTFFATFFKSYQTETLSVKLIYANVKCMNYLLFTFSSSLDCHVSKCSCNKQRGFLITVISHRNNALSRGYRKERFRYFSISLVTFLSTTFVSYKRGMHLPAMMTKPGRSISTSRNVRSREKNNRQ